MVAKRYLGKDGKFYNIVEAPAVKSEKATEDSFVSEASVNAPASVALDSKKLTDISELDLEACVKAELKAFADERELSYSKSVTKKGLIELLSPSLDL